MEDVLDQYERSYDPKYPRIYFDEGLKQLIEETRNGYPYGDNNPNGNTYCNTV